MEAFNIAGIDSVVNPTCSRKSTNLWESPGLEDLADLISYNTPVRISVAGIMIQGFVGRTDLLELKVKL